MLILGRHTKVYQKSPDFVYSIYPGRIRIDDNNHPDFWLEIKLNDQDLEKLGDELQASFNLRHQADLRAIAMWHEAHPDQQLVLPDHADLCVWLLERLSKYEHIPSVS